MSKPKLTVKQAKFVKAKAEGKTGVQAAMEAYDTTDYNVANTIAVENMQKPTVAQALHIAMSKAGITPELIVQPVADGLVATREDGSIDHNVRLKSSGMAAQFLGIKQGETNVNINFNQHVTQQKAKYDL